MSVGADEGAELAVAVEQGFLLIFGGGANVLELFLQLFQLLGYGTGRLFGSQLFDPVAHVEFEFEVFLAVQFFEFVLNAAVGVVAFD